MVNKEIRKVVEATEKAFEEKQQEEMKEAIREVVQKTLESINKLDKEIKELEEKKKILKLDLEDLKNGKLDLIEERQKNSPLAKGVSLVIVNKIVNNNNAVTNPWYVPYQIEWNPVAPVNPPTFWCGTSSYSLTGNELPAHTHTLNSSLVKSSVAGTYKVSGNTVYFR